MLLDELTMRPPEPPESAPGAGAHVPTSEVLQALIDEAPPEHFTLDWLIASLPDRSFGIIMLLLAVLAMVPVGSIVPGLLLVILAAQMCAGRHGPMFPRVIAARPLPTRYLVRMGRQAILSLKYLERVVRPRWPALFGTAMPAIGVVMLLLACLVLLAPLPLTNMPPAFVIALVALAYIEEDGALLAVALFLALIPLGLAAAAVWGAVIGAAAIGHM
jgi:hypothetical protein